MSKKDTIALMAAMYQTLDEHSYTNISNKNAIDMADELYSEAEKLYKEAERKLPVRPRESSSMQKSLGEWREASDMPNYDCDIVYSTRHYTNVVGRYISRTRSVWTLQSGAPGQVELAPILQWRELLI